MSEYPDNYAQEPLFGLGYPTGGMASSAAEQLRTESLARLAQAFLQALGSGIYEGGVGSIVGDDLSISELGHVSSGIEVAGALVPDALGAVPVYSAAATILLAEFAEGVNYVHVQIGETAREDQGCGYYVDASATPAPDALLVLKATVTAGVLTAVDNTVRAAPAIQSRLTWAGLMRVAPGGTQTLLAFLILGGITDGTFSPDMAILGQSPITEWIDLLPNPPVGFVRFYDVEAEDAAVIATMRITPVVLAKWREEVEGWLVNPNKTSEG